MSFPNDGSFVPVFTSLDDATMEPNPEAGTSPTESADASLAAGAIPFCLCCPRQGIVCHACHLQSQQAVFRDWQSDLNSQRT